ncbi:MAG TPA: Yip1 family protein [Candidatus Kapabacteria bacterium]
MQLRNAIEIILHPENEWLRMEEQETERRSLLRYGMTCIVLSHGLLLLWIFISTSNRGVSYPHTSYGPLYLSVAVLFRFAMNLGCLFLLPSLIAELAPSFHGTRDSFRALKLYVFAMTPAWAGMIFGGLGILSGFYSIYLLWNYADVALDIPPLKKVSFVVTIVFLLMILQWIFYAMALPIADLVLKSSS